VGGPEHPRRSGTVSAVATAPSLPEPAPGSTRYFVLLYCPSDRRRALATLLAVADEIEAGLTRSMDHAVAHVRLEWWRQEQQRFARGAPEHPWLSAWLREQPQDRTIDLSALTEAAAIDLASARLAARAERRLAGARFVLGAQLLAPEAPMAQLEQQLRALGSYVAALEQNSSEAAPLLPPASAQGPLTPLLVWVALAEGKAARATRAAGRFAMLADNFIAWSAARRARRGRYTGSKHITEPRG
jgi:hypothetical protein